LLDPLTYGVEGIRYGLLGSSHIDPAICFVILSGFTILMVGFGSYLFRKISI
jgi:ABC-2 type transport system permease protein